MSLCPKCQDCASIDGVTERWISRSESENRCRACWLSFQDKRELNELIDRLARQPHLRAKLREILAVES